MIVCRQASDASRVKLDLVIKITRQPRTFALARLIDMDKQGASAPSSRQPMIQRTYHWWPVLGFSDIIPPSPQESEPDPTGMQMVLHYDGAGSR